jgi:hypothetical protein
MSKPPAEPRLEFSRPLELARVSKLGSHEKLAADASECKALAKRLMVPTIHALTAHLQAKPWRGGGLKVWGEATLDVTQESVISLEAFRTTQVVAVERYYLGGQAATEQDAELESTRSRTALSISENWWRRRLHWNWTPIRANPAKFLLPTTWVNNRRKTPGPTPLMFSNCRSVGSNLEISC